MIARIKPKIERVRPAPVGCSELSWREIVFAMNALPQRVVVQQDALNEVLECHVREGGPTPDLTATIQGRKYVVVDRLALFAFVQEHGAICPGGK